MPLIKSAIKKMRKDKIRTEKNRRREVSVDKFVKAARRNPIPANLQSAFSALDKAVKVHLIHKNKAARLKSQLTTKKS